MLNCLTFIMYEIYGKLLMPTPMGEYQQILDDFIRLCKRHKSQSEQVVILGEKIETSKKDVILKLRDCLIKQAEQNKKPIDLEKISAEIAKDVKEFVTVQYINRVLGPEFTQEKYVTEKNKVKKSILVTADGGMEQQQEPKTESPPPRDETTAEMNQRLRANWRVNPYDKLTHRAGAKQEKAYKKKDEEQERKSGAYTGPSIGPKEDLIEEEEEETILVTLDTDQIDEIVMLRTERHAMAVRLEIDMDSKQVIGIK
jgi:hypothetical protein